MNRPVWADRRAPWWEAPALFIALVLMLGGVGAVILCWYP